MNKLSRRQILQFIPVLAAAPVLTRALQALSVDSAFAADAVPKDFKIASPDYQIPKTMQYVSDGTKGNPAIRKDKTAFCYNCTQYGVTHKEFTHPKEGKVATCEIFIEGKDKLFVHNKGWCMAWQKKAAK